MGTKRSYDAMAAGPMAGGAEDRVPETQGGGAGPAAETPRMAAIQQREEQNKKHKPKEGSKAWVKKRARNLQRRFQRDLDNVPADVQKELERELDAHRQRIDQDREKKLRNNMIRKYHMVRFFERRRAERLAKKLRRSLETATDPEETASLRADLHIAEVDEAYAKSFPLMQRYVSLYPPQSREQEKKEKEKDKEGGEDAEKDESWRDALHTERPEMWKTVEAALQKGPAALGRLREQRPIAGGKGSAGTITSVVAATAKPGSGSRAEANLEKRQKAQGRKPEAAKNGASAGRFQRNEPEVGDDSDSSGGGGFFEMDDD